MTDHDIERAAEIAARELARRIRANPDPADPDAFARAFIADLRAEGWRPIPRTPAIERQAAGSPPPPEWRRVADKIRARADGSGDE
jgi:hypothetical protein